MRAGPFAWRLRRRLASFAAAPHALRDNAAEAVRGIVTRPLSTTETAECNTLWLMVVSVPAGSLLLAFEAPGLAALAPAVLVDVGFWAC